MCLWVQPRVSSSLPVHSAAASGPAGVVELGNDPRKAVLMNSAHPSSTPRHPSSIHPFISPYGATLRGHIRPLTYEDEHADQQCYECPGAESCAHYVGCGIACLDGSICVVKKKKDNTHINQQMFSNVRCSGEYVFIMHAFKVLQLPAPRRWWGNCSLIKARGRGDLSQAAPTRKVTVTIMLVMVRLPLQLAHLCRSRRRGWSACPWS